MATSHQHEAPAPAPAGPQRVPVVDPAAGDPAGRHLLAELARGNWAEAAALLDTVIDWDDRAFYVNLCAQASVPPDTSTVPSLGWLDQWSAERPQDPDAVLVRGVHGVHLAWRARGARTAEDTPQAAIQRFWELLERAEADLREAAARAPADPTPWCWLLASCRGLQLGLDELRERFEEVLARHPWHWEAHRHMLQGLCAKWGGSHQLMLSFARERAAAAPRGILLPLLVAEAHVEHRLALASDQEYFENDEVMREVRGAAERSVFDSGYRSQPGWPRAFNLLAYCFARGDEIDWAMHCFEALGGLVTETPWIYASDDPGRGYLDHYQWVAETYRSRRHARA